MRKERALGGSDLEVLGTSVELSFFGHSSPERWREFVESLGCQLRPSAAEPQNPHMWYTSIHALPDIIDPDSRYMTGDVHPLRRHPEETHWTLRLELVPSPNPPSSIVETSQRLGGYPRVLERIMAGWPAERHIEVESTVTFLLDEKVWRSPFAPPRRLALKPISSGGQQAKLSFESYSWDLEPAGPLGKVMDLGYVGGNDGLFALRCSGQQLLDLEPTIFSRVEETLWHTVRGFLKKPSRRRMKR